MLEKTHTSSYQNGIMDNINKRKKTQNITVVKMIRKTEIYDEKFKSYRSKAKQNTQACVSVMDNINVTNLK